MKSLKCGSLNFDSSVIKVFGNCKLKIISSLEYNGTEFWQYQSKTHILALDVGTFVLKKHWIKNCESIKI